MLFDVIIPSDHRERRYTNPGYRYKDEYKLIYDEDGRAKLEVVDQTDLYAYIQSFKDSVDINKLLERFQETGDMSIFMQRRTEPIYADFLDMPKTVAEMYQRVNDVNEAFLRLDPAIREKFGNSPSQWLASYGTPDWTKNMGLEGSNLPSEPVKIDEVNKDAE